MKQFDGFPARMQFTPVPNLFLNRLMSRIDDIGELKTTLHIFRLAYGKRGFPQVVSRGELLADSGVSQSLKDSSEETEVILDSALDKAVKRGTVINLEYELDDGNERIFLINTAKNREAAEKMKTGEIVPEGLKAGALPRISGDIEPLPDIYTLYEENVGMLNPMVADWLKEAEEQYPESWIRDAIKEAVSLNKRNWRYIDRILETWAAEGRDDGTYRRDSKTDPARYRKQKYDHLVKH